MSTTTAEDVGWPELQRARRAIVVVDVVESVRLMQQHETDVINRWRRFVNEVQTQVLPKHGGRLVKSLGDGMLLEFESVPSSVAAAFDIQARVAPYNDGRDTGSAIYLRVGIHVANVVLDSLDMYGAGVNLGARLASLAKPGEIVASVEARDEMTDGITAEVEDLGACFVKHLAAPIRAYRIGQACHGDFVASSSGDGFKPTIVVLAANLPGTTARASDCVLVDDLISVLSASNHWNVISRLTTCRLAAHAGLERDRIRGTTGATYGLSISCLSDASQTQLSIEFSDLRDGRVLWSDLKRVSLDAVLQGDRSVAAQIVEEVCKALLVREVTRIEHAALPNLDDYALLLSSMGLMHRMSRPSAERAGAALEHLEERHPRLPEPKAWLAKWHVIRIAQDWSTDRSLDATHADDLLRRALDSSPDHALSLTIDGLVHAFLKRDFQVARARYDAALSSNPNEPLAWLFRSSIDAHEGRGSEALQSVERARALSPLDPMGYYFDGFHAWACLAARKYEVAVDLAKKSLRANADHLPALITLTLAHSFCHHTDQARSTAERLLSLGSKNQSARYFSVDRYLAGFPCGGQSVFAAELRDALFAAGLPR